MSEQDDVNPWTYDADFGMGADHPLDIGGKKRLEAIRRSLDPYRDELKRAAVLDLGANKGLGVYLPYIRPEQITAVDSSADNLRLNPARRQVFADLNDEFSFAQDATYGAVTAFFLNRYIEDQYLLMREILRVLKPGGRFIMVDYTTLSHPREVTQFDPYSFMRNPFLNQDIANPLISELAPSSQWGSQGPLYLFTGTKSTGW